MNRYHLSVPAVFDLFVYAENADEIDAELVAKALRDDTDLDLGLLESGAILVDKFEIIDEIVAHGPDYRTGQEV